MHHEINAVWFTNHQNSEACLSELINRNQLKPCACIHPLLRVHQLVKLLTVLCRAVVLNAIEKARVILSNPKNMVVPSDFSPVEEDKVTVSHLTVQINPSLILDSSCQLRDKPGRQQSRGVEAHFNFLSEQSHWGCEVDSIDDERHVPFEQRKQLSRWQGVLQLKSIRLEKRLEFAYSSVSELL